MDLLLSMRGSKKTSEAGVWVADDEVKACMCCKASFGLFIRKHHCRQCGSVVCGDCSSNRKFLESSRTGAPKPSLSSSATSPASSAHGARLATAVVRTAVATCSTRLPL